MKYRVTVLTPTLVGDGEKLSPIDYMVWRNQRDVVRDKPRPAAKDKDGKAKPPFVDRVLEKGLEHLREKIKKLPEPPIKRDA